MADVIASLQRSNALPLYSHIERIESPTAPDPSDIHLRQPDRWLPSAAGAGAGDGAAAGVADHEPLFLHAGRHRPLCRGA